VQVQALGHVVLKVRDLDRSEGFYSDVLGMRIISRISDPRMTFFRLPTSNNHHDFALIGLGPHAASQDQDAIGLAHLAFRIGASREDLHLVRDVLQASATTVLYEAERAFTKSLHVLDPDGNEIELYIETSDAWKTDREAHGTTGYEDGLTRS
jgi:catechol 2,3-dioxygenase